MLLKRYFTFLRLAFLNRFSYRFELATSFVVGVLIFAGQAIFWKVVFEGRDEVNGIIFSQIIMYYLLVRVISEATDSQLGPRVSQLVITGQITTLSLKPISIQLVLLFEEVGRVSVDLITKGSLFIVLYLVILGMPELSAGSLFGFLFALAVSFVICFSIFLIVGCLAFWTENSAYLTLIIRRIIVFLAGALVPVSFFPDIMKKVLSVLPFDAIFELPISFVNGTSDVSALAVKLGYQVLLAVVLWFAAGAFLKISLRKNESVGI